MGALSVILAAQSSCPIYMHSLAVCDFQKALRERLMTTLTAASLQSFCAERPPY